MTDALNHRVGPHTGCPFKCLTHWSMEKDPSPGGGGGIIYVPNALNNRESPQAGEPSKRLNGWSYRERLAKEAF